MFFSISYKFSTLPLRVADELGVFFEIVIDFSKEGDNFKAR